MNALYTVILHQHQVLLSFFLYIQRLCLLLQLLHGLSDYTSNLKSFSKLCFTQLLILHLMYEKQCCYDGLSVCFKIFQHGICYLPAHVAILLILFFMMEQSFCEFIPLNKHKCVSLAKVSSSITSERRSQKLPLKKGIHTLV